ncbi:hypothetical protein GCM10023340_25650 [Nocardioides marinquilinus]|uniref:GH18 domain-containing protein n=1 Tax=Nocardioides marinquilinus TaxID=1210400 RepID=A0ABP9PQR8_9ACTN
MRRTALALVATLLVVPALPAPAGAAVRQPASRADDGLAVTGYALGSTPAEVVRRDADALTTVTIAAVPLSADGRSVGAPTRDMTRLRGVAARQGLRTELLLSNYSNGLGGFDERRAHRLLSSPAAIRRVAERLATLVRSGGWDGVNVDLELVREGDAGGLVRLVTALQQAMPPARTVSIDISASTSLRSYRERGYALGALGRAVDVVQLMAYDQHGPGWSGPGAVGALAWQRASVRTALTRVPASRLDLGVAGYGYLWPGEGTSRRGRTVKPGGARAMAAAAGVRPVWHATEGEWSARLPDGSTLWWADARSYRQRVTLARELGLHGLAVWRLGSADPLP